MLRVSFRARSKRQSHEQKCLRDLRIAAGGGTIWLTLGRVNGGLPQVHNRRNPDRTPGLRRASRNRCFHDTRSFNLDPRLRWLWDRCAGLASPFSGLLASCNRHFRRGLLLGIS